MSNRCPECKHDKDRHMINGYKQAVCQVGGLTEDPCQCLVTTFVPRRVWNEATRQYDE